MHQLSVIFDWPSYICTCTKTCIAICLRKTSVYRNVLYIRVCNSRNIVSAPLCLGPFLRLQIVLSRKVWHFVVAYMWRKLWSYLHSYLNSPRLTYRFLEGWHQRVAYRWCPPPRYLQIPFKLSEEQAHTEMSRWEIRRGEDPITPLSKIGL